MKRICLAISIFLCTAFSFANANDVSIVTVVDVSECSITLTEMPASVENAFVFDTVELQVGSNFAPEDSFRRISSELTVSNALGCRTASPTEVGWRNLHQV